MSVASYLRQCFLKEIGILKDFVARKSEKIDKIENKIHKRHLPISLLATLAKICK